MRDNSLPYLGKFLKGCDFCSLFATDKEKFTRSTCGCNSRCASRLPMNFSPLLTEVRTIWCRMRFSTPWTSRTYSAKFPIHSVLVWFWYTLPRWNLRRCTESPFRAVESIVEVILLEAALRRLRTRGAFLKKFRVGLVGVVEAGVPNTPSEPSACAFNTDLLCPRASRGYATGVLRPPPDLCSV